MKSPPTLPAILFVELIAEILSWLPVKTLMQIKCVCKLWKTIIFDDPSFAKLHLHRSRQNTHLALIPNWSTRPNQYLDCSVVPFPISHLIQDPDITVSKDPYYRLKDMDCSFVVGSCNGLFCLIGFSRFSGYTWFRFWNPATNSLSKKLEHLFEQNIKFTFGHDTFTNTSKVVAFGAKKVKIFSLGDNTWREIQSFRVIPFGFEA